MANSPRLHHGNKYSLGRRTFCYSCVWLAGRILSVSLTPGSLRAQDKVFICPMDPDVRSNQPGTCRRCGMKLREGIPEPVEFHMDLALTPRAVKPNQTEQLKFSVHDPWKDRPVKDFQIVHEKLFHMFVVSQDLQFFVHDHPVFSRTAIFFTVSRFPSPACIAYWAISIPTARRRN